MAANLRDLGHDTPLFRFQRTWQEKVVHLPCTNVYLSDRPSHMLVDVGPTERTVDDLADEIKIGHFFSHSEPDKIGREYRWTIFPHHSALSDKLGAVRANAL